MYTFLSTIKYIQLPLYYLTVIGRAKFLNIEKALLVCKCG